MQITVFLLDFQIKIERKWKLDLFKNLHCAVKKWIFIISKQIYVLQVNFAIQIFLFQLDKSKHNIDPTLIQIKHLLHKSGAHILFCEIFYMSSINSIF